MSKLSSVFNAFFGSILVNPKTGQALRSFKPKCVNRQTPKWPLTNAERDKMSTLNGKSKKSFIKEMKVKYEG